MSKYQPNLIESKWQEYWQNTGTYDFKLDPTKPSFYNLVELPYPSGDLHVGHWFTFTTADVVARFKRMSGQNVFFTNGYDAFGLPAENAAIKRNIHPKDWTYSNIASMTKQFKTLGTMIDWKFSLQTCDPEYYKWNQWIFLKLLEKGLAYQGKALSNWCPSCQTVLANENIEAGKCWRCGSTVEQKEISQWFFKITEYADQLIWPASPKLKRGEPDSPDVDWPTSVRVGQNNWIGRSEGMLIDFNVIPAQAGIYLNRSRIKSGMTISVFTTRPETIDGATFLVIAPEHPLVSLVDDDKVADYVIQANKKTEMDRKENKDKSGVFIGLYAQNPVTKQDIPIWVSDYVLAGYGTGAIMAVPGEDDRDRAFAEKFDLPIVKSSLKARPIGEVKVQYHIHDWSVSRQRYWGTPVPVIHCPKDGVVPVPESELPVELPYDVDYAPKGKPPLASDEKWLKVKCPKCGGPAERDAETLDTFVDSSWYYYRYLDPHYSNGPFNPDKVKAQMPVSVYFGGSEHTLGHTLYARFMTKFFKDLGLVDIDEFAMKRIQHGIVLGPDGNRMSKSKGNVINPDDVVKEYGSDTVRLYLCFMMPYEATGPWSNTAIAGSYRFLTRFWDLRDKLGPVNLDKTRLIKLNQTVKKVTEDLEDVKNNTAIACLMEWLNFLAKQDQVSHQEYQTFLLLLAPFAPHLTEELWNICQFSEGSIHLQTWPVVDSQYLVNQTISLPVSVNGRVRDQVQIDQSDQANKSMVEELALASPKVQKFLNGQIPTTIIYVPGKILNLVIS